MTVRACSESPLKAGAQVIVIMSVRNFVEADVRFAIHKTRDPVSTDTAKLLFDGESFASTVLLSSLSEDGLHEISPEVQQVIARDNPKILTQRHKSSLTVLVPIILPPTPKTEARVRLSLSFFFFFFSDFAFPSFRSSSRPHTSWPRRRSRSASSSKLVSVPSNN